MRLSDDHCLNAPFLGNSRASLDVAFVEVEIILGVPSQLQTATRTRTCEYVCTPYLVSICLGKTGAKERPRTTDLNLRNMVHGAPSSQIWPPHEDRYRHRKGSIGGLEHPTPEFSEMALLTYQCRMILRASGALNPEVLVLDSGGQKGSPSPCGLCGFVDLWNGGRAPALGRDPAHRGRLGRLKRPCHVGVGLGLLG